MLQGLPGLVQTVQLPPFVEEIGFGTVEVLRRIIPQGTSTEGDDTAARVADREGDAIAETVVAAVGGVIAAGNQQPGGQRRARILELQGQTVPAIRGEPNAKAACRTAVDTARLEIVDGDLGVAQGRLEVALRLFQRRQRPLGRGPGAGAPTALARHLHTDGAGQLFHCLDEIEAVKSHQEANGVAVLPRAEIEIHLLCRTDEEARGLFIGKGRQAAPFPARALEFDARRNDLDNVDARQQITDEGFWNAAVHDSPSRGAAGRCILAPPFARRGPPPRPCGRAPRVLPTAAWRAPYRRAPPYPRVRLPGA